MAAQIRKEQISGGIDGWISAGETWTYASADDPTYTFTVNADVTTKYSAGMRIKLTQGTVKYFIITAVSTYSGGKTTITVYGGTDYDLASSAISANAYSMMRTPLGFPMSPAKWRTRYSSTSDVAITPNAMTWSTFTGAELSVPIGVWSLSYVCNSFDRHASTAIETKRTLSTTTNSITHVDFTDAVYFGLMRNDVQFSKDSVVELSSKTTFYLLGFHNNQNTTLENRGSTDSPTYITATCAYL